MGGTKPNKDRTKNVQKFKDQAKQEASQQKIPRTHLVPVPTWQSNENLEFRGDLLESCEQQLYAALENIQKIGQVIGMVMQQNIKNEKIKIEYVWNNGEKPTEAEVTTFKAQMDEIQAEKVKQATELEENAKKAENFAKTGLVNPNGQPIATTQDLNEVFTDEFFPDEVPNSELENEKDEDVPLENKED